MNYLFCLEEDSDLISGMEKKGSRFKQRFIDFESTFLRLKEAIELKELNELGRNGLAKRFEFAIDLSWKTMNDLLEEKGYVFKISPKDAFSQAQEANFIDYAMELKNGLDIKNELSHDYNGENFRELEEQLRKEIFPAMEKLYGFFLSQLQTS